MKVSAMRQNVDPSYRPRYREAYYQGALHREQTEPQEVSFSAWKARFYISIVLFLLFVAWDYTGAVVQEQKSEVIVEQITRDAAEEWESELAAFFAF